MWWALLIIVVVLIALWSLSSTSVTIQKGQRFQENCRLQTTGKLPPEQIKALIEHTTTQINNEVARYTEPIKVGMVTVKGIDKVRLTEVKIGDESQVLPCTSSCVCQRSEHFPQGAALRLVGVTATVVAPDIEVSFLGGLGRVTTTVEATVRGVDAVIESDCKQGLVVTSIDLKEVEITKPGPSTMLGRLLAKVPQQKEQLLEGLRANILNKVLTLPTQLAEIPLLCKDVKGTSAQV